MSRPYFVSAATRERAPRPTSASIAIMTSRRAHDARVRDLANSIIDPQMKEIGEMEALIADIEAHADARGQVAPVH